MPDAVIKRIEQAGEPEQESVAIGSELISEYADIPGVAGVAISGSVEPATIVAAIEGAGC